MGDKAIDIKEAIEENIQNKILYKKKITAKSFSPLLTNLKLVYTVKN